MEKLTEIHKSWWGQKRNAIIHDCTKPNASNYHRLGANGIKLCDRWRKSVRDFRDDILAEIGDRPSPAHGLTRLDESRDFEPGNMIWMTQSELAQRAGAQTKARRLARIAAV